MTAEEIAAMEEKLGAKFIKSTGRRYYPNHFRKGEGEGETYFDMEGNPIASPWEANKTPPGYGNYGIEPSPQDGTEEPTPQSED